MMNKGHSAFELFDRFLIRAIRIAAGVALLGLAVVAYNYMPGVLSTPFAELTLGMLFKGFGLGLVAFWSVILAWTVAFGER